MAYKTNHPNVSSGADSDFYCGRCGDFFTSLSGTRFPNYNPDNCSCPEAARANHNFGGGTVLLQSEQSLYQYDNTTAILFERPPAPVSYASSNQSRGRRGPEEPERELPNTQLTSGFLPVVPERGLGEDRHRRTSFRSELSYQMRRCLQEQQEAFELQEREAQQQQAMSYNTSRSQGQSVNKFLNQEVHMCQVSGQGSGKTKSWDSEGSGGSGESALETWETTPVNHYMGVGAWAVGEGAGLGIGGVNMERCGYARYPMSMSGMTEALYELERR